MSYKNEGTCSCLLDCVTPLCRIWGIATAIGMYGIGTDVVFHRSSLGIYILVVAMLLSFLEITWVVTLFIELCIRNEEDNTCLRCWNRVLWVDKWKKSVLYAILSAPMFIKPRAVWMALISGSMLFILALLYLSATYKSRLATKEGLLGGGSGEGTYDRFQCIEDELDDTFPETTAATDKYEAEILEV